MCRNKLFPWIFLISLLFCSNFFPQTVEPKFDWVPAVLPNCVFQDSYGFIWIGDQDGLIKYDGYNKKEIQTNSI